MHSDDFLQSDEVVEFFEKALREEGIENVQVAHATTHFTDEFYIRKKVGTEQIAYKTSFDFSNREPDPVKVRKQIAREAEEVAEAFREKLVDSFEWDGRRVEVSIMDGAWAKCTSCGSRVELPRMPEVAFSADAELSTPKPIPRDIESVLGSLSDYERTILKLYLVGHLRQQCEPTCRNSRYNHMDLPPAHIDQKI